MKNIRKLFLTAVITLAITLMSMPLLAAETRASVDLDEVFNQTVIIPFDFKDKAFTYGDVCNMNAGSSDKYKLYNIDNRVLVPIRLISSLISNSTVGVQWQTNWLPSKPNDVDVYNNNQKIKLKVGSNVMLVNDKEVKIDVPAKLINGRVVLPLRAISEAIGKDVYWQGDMVIISSCSDKIDIGSAVSRDVLSKSKNILADKRDPIDQYGIDQLRPVHVYNGVSYFVKYINSAEGSSDRGYYKLFSSKNNKNVEIKLSGHPEIGCENIVDNVLYYPTLINGKTYIYSYDFVKNTDTKLCDMSAVNWNLGDGWISQVVKVENQYIVIAHIGDLTMGGETVYVLDNGKLTKVGSVDSVHQVIVNDSKAYLADFDYNNFYKNNLYEIDLNTKKMTNVALNKGYIYNIRNSQSNGSYSHNALQSMTIVDNKLYLTAYLDNGDNKVAKHQLAVINLDDYSQELLDINTNSFTINKDTIRYKDFETNNYISYNIESKVKTVMIDASVKDAAQIGQNIFYTKQDGNGMIMTGLYCYDMTKKTNSKVSDSVVKAFLPGKNNLYYVANGYMPGIYKVLDSKANIKLDSRQVGEFVYRGDQGIVYNLTYEKGIFNVK